MEPALALASHQERRSSLRGSHVFSRERCPGIGNLLTGETSKAILNWTDSLPQRIRNRWEDYYMPFCIAEDSLYTFLQGR